MEAESINVRLRRAGRHGDAPTGVVTGTGSAPLAERLMGCGRGLTGPDLAAAAGANGAQARPRWS